MKNSIKVALLMFGLMIFQQTYCSQEQNSEALEFPQHTTEKYMYNKSVEKVTHSDIYTRIFGKKANGVSITDTTSEDLLSNRVTRKKVETITENGMSIITTETWVSRNPSYITWVNGALVVSAIAAITLGASAIQAGGNLGAGFLQGTGNLGAGFLQSAGTVFSDPVIREEIATAIGKNAAGWMKQMDKTAK